MLRCIARRRGLHGRQALREGALTWETVVAFDTNARGVVVYRPVGHMPPREDCRKRLVETALKLFASRGYHNTGIADILRESGCTRGMLYHYFSSKEDLGYAAIDQALQQLFERGAVSRLVGNEHPIDRLCNGIEAMPMVTKLGTIGASVSDVSLRMVPVHDGFRQRFQERAIAIVAQVEEIVRRGVAEGQIADSVDPEQLAHLYFTIAGGIQYIKLVTDQEVVWQDAQRWLKEYLNSLRK